MVSPSSSTRSGDPGFSQILYKDVAARNLIERLLSGNLSQLTPILDSSGKPVYLEVLEAVGGDKIKAEALVENLTETGILEKKFLEMWVGCPSCGSMNVSILYRCPNCNSFNIYRRRLYEHVSCGTLDSLEHFKKGGLLVCPKCGRSLKENSPEFKEVGSWFECRECNTRFDEPRPIHRCRACGLKFLVKDMELIPVYALTLSEEAKAEYERSFMLLTPIKVRLEGLGYKVEMPGNLTGSSGAAHKFDLIASKSEDINAAETIVVDAVMSQNELDETPVAAMFAKIFDVKPKDAILIAIPRLKESGKKLAQLYKIKTIEADEIEEAAEKIEAYLFNSK